MAYISLKSDNPSFSHVIKKNPASGLIAKEIRQGTTFAWYTPGGENEYNIYFKDSDFDTSYKDHPDSQFEYLNVSAYNSTIFILNAIGEFLATALKKPHEKDVDGDNINEFFINLVELPSIRFLTIFSKYFPEYEIVSEEIAPKNFKITFKTKNSIYKLLNFVNLFATINIIRSRIEYKIDDSQIDKNFKCLSIVQAPYYIKYLFKVYFLHYPKLFDKYKTFLDTEDTKFTFGDTWVARKRFLDTKLQFNNDILDVGCGEGRYLTEFAKKLINKDSPGQTKQYFGVDSNQEELDVVANKIEKKELENVVLSLELPDKEEIKNADILLIEVIEHMEFEAAQEFLRKVREYDFNQIIISSPNKDFNEYYLFDEDQLRHADHKFELTEKEFRDLIANIFYGLNIEVCSIGDMVKGITPTNVAVIKNPNKVKS